MAKAGIKLAIMTISQHKSTLSKPMVWCNGHYVAIML
ncbi:hypothetical protein B0I21_107118 [Sphingobacterium paludis]|uniref:Uncharacterized protein n=1 Tax=Sphingobacterium paludis TaxID=1476465 RepID=A0A4R7CXG9_9SPHI|nr:hypothetical protein B0I21_107118 [Sphingobacterium paludis]